MTAAREDTDAARMDNRTIKRTSQFTIYHGFALSFALHSAIVTPIVVRRFIPVRQEPTPLVIDFEEAEPSERQVEEKLLEQTKAQELPEEKEAAQPKEKEEEKPEERPSPKQQQVAPAPEQEHEPLTDDMDAPPPPPPPKPQQEEKKPVEKPVESFEQPAPPAAEQETASSGAENKKGADAQQKAETVKRIDRAEIQAYSVLLSKRIRAHLAYPEGGRRSGLQGVPKVAFTILSDGQLRPESLRLVKSSGLPQLDASALQAIRASAPFDPPPTEIPVVMDVNFFKER